MTAARRSSLDRAHGHPLGVAVAVGLLVIALLAVRQYGGAVRPRAQGVRASRRSSLLLTRERMRCHSPCERTVGLAERSGPWGNHIRAQGGGPDRHP